jgi:phosphinothricin acetyltransferase
LSVEIRPGHSGDLERLVEIYNYYIKHTHAAFSENEYGVEDRREWLGEYSAAGVHRLFVAVDGDRLLGYATSSRYRPQLAFRNTVESSVYLDPGAVGRGLGGRLYDCLLTALVETPAERVLAAVALPNPASIALHLSRGFTVVGTFTDYAVKNGQAISSTWLERGVREKPE